MKKLGQKGLKYRILPVGILVLATAFTGCGLNGQEAESAEAEVRQVVVNSSNLLADEQVSKVVYGDVLKRELHDGVITPYVEELFFAEDGVFLEYCVAVGECVTEGQVIAKTDNESVQETVEQLQEKVDSLVSDYEYQMATLQNAKAILEEEREISYIELEYMDYLSAQYTATCQTIGRQTKSIAEKELEMKQLTEEYELELPYYQKRLKEAKNTLDTNVIRAPFDGTVVQLRSVSSGERVSAELAYVAVADTGRLLAVGTYVNNSTIQKAERVYVFINGKEYEAEYIPLESEVYSRMLAKGSSAYSTYEIQTEDTIDYGQTAIIAVQRESRKNVLVVPAIGVQRESSLYYCYVKRGEEREKVYIEVGLYDGLNYEVVSGLAEGDEVYIE